MGHPPLIVRKTATAPSGLDGAVEDIGQEMNTKDGQWIILNTVPAPKVSPDTVVP
jgi:hypothetical protein